MNEKEIRPFVIEELQDYRVLKVKFKSIEEQAEFGVSLLFPELRKCTEDEIRYRQMRGAFEEALDEDEQKIFEMKYNVPKLPMYFQETGYTGFYFRVLKEGWVSPVDTLKWLESDPKGVTVAFANRIIHKEKQNVEGLNRILEVKSLSTSCRKTFEKRMRGEEISTKERIEGKKE